MQTTSIWASHGALALAGLLFGTTFLVMQDAVEAAEPVPFLAVRFLIGAVALWVVGRRRPSAPGETGAGLVCGLVLLGGYVFQTVGLQYTTSSVSAFVTYLLIVFVPVIAALTLRRKPSRATLTGVVVATVGLFLLTGDGAGFGKGEAFTLVCALAFAVHIVLLAAFAPRYDACRLTAVQLTVAGALALGPGALLGGYRLSWEAWLAAVYTGIAVSALASALQVWGQARVGPTRASLLLMVEPVSAALLGWAAGERLGFAGVAGAALILAGIAAAEVPVARRRAVHLRTPTT